MISREKMSKKIWVKNSWKKCWGFVKTDFLDKNLTFRIVWYSRLLRVHPESTKWTRRKKSPYKNKETTRYAEWNSPWQNMSYHRTKKEEWKNPKFRNTRCNYTLGLSWSTCSTWKQFDDLKDLTPKEDQDARHGMLDGCNFHG